MSRSTKSSALRKSDAVRKSAAQPGVVYRYPVRLEQDSDGGYLVTFADFPEAVTQGQDRKDALVQAVDCLDEALAARVSDGERIPRPYLGKSLAVEPSAQIQAKVILYMAFQEAGIARTALARKLGVAETEVRRMLDPRHATKLSRLEEALAALGKRLRLQAVEGPK